MDQLPSFLAGARFHASDGLSPSWLAVYDVTDASTFSDENYTRLRLQRSAREADLLKRLHTLDRRTYELVHDTGGSDLTSSFRCSSPTKVLVTHSIQLDCFDSGWWDVNVLPSLTAVDGWVRTRVFRCIESRKIGTSVSSPLDGQAVPPYLALHGRCFSLVGVNFEMILGLVELFDHRHVERFDIALNATPLASFNEEYRQWQLHRAYPGLSQRNTSG